MSPLLPPDARPGVQRLVFGALALIVALILLRQLMPPRYDTDLDLAAFGRLPAQEGGRIKPIDSIARANLLLIANRSSVVDGGERLSALEWFTELVLAPGAAVDRRIFRIDHPQVAGILGIDNEERNYVSLREILPHFETLQGQWQGVPEEPQLRNPYQRALIKLADSVGLYDTLAYAFVPPPVFGRDDVNYSILRRALADRAEKEPGTEEYRTVTNAINLFATQYARLARSLALQSVPPEQAPETGFPEWQNLGASLIESTQTGQIDPVVEKYALLSEAYANRDAATFNRIVAELAPILHERGAVSAGRVQFEHFFNTVDPFTAAEVLYVLVFLVAAASWLVLPRTLATAAFWITLVAFLLHTFGLLARMYIQGRPPVTNLYSSAIFVGWGAVFLCLILERIFRNGIAAAAAAPDGFCTMIIAYHLSYSGDTLEMMQAVLDSNFWLATHVPTVTIGYSAVFLAGSLAMVYIVRDRLFGGVPKDQGKSISGMVYGILCFALFFSFVGTVLGGIWADQSWGRFWGWDPKENGALMIVLWVALILHARWAKLAGPIGIMQLTVFGNIITAWSWFGTNMLGVGLHSYGFMDEAFVWLSAFVISQLGIIALGWMPPIRQLVRESSSQS